MEIIKKLWDVREQKKITRNQMAEYLCISKDTYKDIEYGKIRLSLENFINICKILEISPMELLKDNPNEHFVLISTKDIDNLNKIINKLNNQIIHQNINSNNAIKNSHITIGNNNNINDSFK